MTKRTQRKSTLKDMKRRHYFFLNPYEDCAFTKSPQCNAKTKVRKFPLVIHIEPQQLFLLNKQCKYCVNCDLIITKQSEVEQLMEEAFHQRNPGIVGNDYLVMGTLDKKDWRKSNKEDVDSSEAFKWMYVFKDHLNFEVAPAGWYSDQ
ncbi:MAG: hypothetical protein Q3M24_12800 [Candidatus Electrothrix aestuarii]|uniref:Uncharacterized protein n=1 Tax=Candidatus Electrothrix aestuarii TaxID=3062594 RepID=A0AAU8LQM6_9BACT|nr:hypothetical protein [Candidatus Electrothrix aestuarii]